MTCNPLSSSSCGGFSASDARAAEATREAANAAALARQDAAAIEAGFARFMQQIESTAGTGQRRQVTMKFPSTGYRKENPVYTGIGEKLRACGYDVSYGYWTKGEVTAKW